MYVCLEAIHGADINVTVGQKVTLPCYGPTTNSSISWLYRQSKSSNSRLILSAKRNKTIVFQSSGRFAANRTSFSTFTLVIHEVQLTDSGFYGCASNDIYRIVRLRVQRKHFLSCYFHCF